MVSPAGWRCRGCRRRCSREPSAPSPSRFATLDALHPASLDHPHHRGQDVERAGYDHRMTAAACAMEIPVHDLKTRATAAPANGP